MAYKNFFPIPARIRPQNFTEKKKIGSARGRDSRRGSETVLQGYAFEVFDQVLSLKKEYFEHDFSDKLKVQSKVSRYYHLAGVKKVLFKYKPFRKYYNSVKSFAFDLFNGV